MYQEYVSLLGHEKGISCVKFKPDNGYVLASSSADSRICLWNTEQGRKLDNLLGHVGEVSEISWSKSRPFLISASDDFTCKLWDTNQGQCCQTFNGHFDCVFCCNFNSNSSLALSGSLDTTLRMWDTRTGDCIKALYGHDEPVVSVHFSPDDILILSASMDGLVKIWDTRTTHCLKSIGQESEKFPSLTCARFVADGKLILAGNTKSEIHLWQYRRGTGRILKTYKGHLSSRLCIFSTVLQSDEKQLVISGSEDNMLYVWDMKKGDLQQTLQRHTDVVLTCDASFITNSIATGSLDTTIRIWKL